MFTERSQEKELLDLGPAHYTHDEYIECLKKLFSVNKIFGFFRGTVKTLKIIPQKSSLLDVGCGGGLFILHLSKIFPTMKMLGVDISNTAINDAKISLRHWQKKTPKINVSFNLQEHSHLDFMKNSFDIILATLVCHHLSNDELIAFLQKVQGIASKAVIINDLHRHRFAHWMYRILSPLIFRNRLITHDGLISIRRGFTKPEWQQLLNKAGIKNYQLTWCFPFRWQLILWK